MVRGGSRFANRGRGRNAARGRGGGRFPNKKPDKNRKNAELYTNGVFWEGTKTTQWSEPQARTKPKNSKNCSRAQLHTDGRIPTC